MSNRIVDERKAWLEAAKDLGICVVAPFALQASDGELVTYEAHVADFGGPNGAVVGTLEDEPPWEDVRHTQGYWGSNLGLSYRRYDRQFFIDTLNDWQWFGDPNLRPPWYTGKP